MSQQYKLGSGHTTIKTDKAGITTITFWSTDIDGMILNRGINGKQNNTEIKTK